MKETKAVQIHPSEENEQINLWGKFGWEVQSSQEIYNQNTKDLGDKVVTTTTNYVKLVFSRDTSMPNYDKIRSYENDYDRKSANIASLSSTEPSINPIAAGILLLLYVVPGIIYIVAKSKKKSAWRNETLPQINTLQMERDTILTASQNLLR